MVAWPCGIWAKHHNDGSVWWRIGRTLGMRYNRQRHVASDPLPSASFPLNVSTTFSTVSQELNMGAYGTMGHAQMVTVWIPLSFFFYSQIVWHFGGWSAWEPSPPLPAPVWPWAQATWRWPSAWPAAHLLWPQLLGWHTDQRSQPCPLSVLFLGQKPQFDEAELGRGGR